MITPSRAPQEEYQRLIEIGESALQNTNAHWHEIPVERIPIARFGQGLDGLFIAVGHLMLGQVSQARDWFAICAQFFLEASKPADTVVSEKRALECALFSGNKDFRVRVAQKISPRHDQIKPMEHSYTMFLKYTILNEPIEALTFTEEAAWLSRATMKKRGSYGSLQDACQALASGDADQFTIMLEALLREHQIKVADGGIKLPDGMVCFPGAALMILAREQGLRVDITSPFLPAALLG